MDKSVLGELIYFYRKDKKISQEKLCKGLCAVSGICRIEKGGINVPMLVSQTLLERMGVAANRVELISNDLDEKKYHIRIQIEKAIETRKWEEAQRLIDEYKNEQGQYRKLDYQYIAFQKARILLGKDECREEARSLLEKAAGYCVSLPLKDRKNLTLLSVMEVELFFAMACMDIEDKKLQQAEELLVSLRDYEKENYSKELQEINYPRIQLKLAELYFEEKRYTEAVQAAEEGLEIAYQGRSYRNVADLHFLYAQALWTDSKEKKEEKSVRDLCIQRCKQAYVLYEFDRNERVEHVKTYITEELGWQFTV